MIILYTGLRILYWNKCLQNKDDNRLKIVLPSHIKKEQCICSSATSKYQTKSNCAKTLYKYNCYCKLTACIYYSNIYNLTIGELFSKILYMSTLHGWLDFLAFLIEIKQITSLMFLRARENLAKKLSHSNMVVRAVRYKVYSRMGLEMNSRKLICLIRLSCGP